MKRRKFLQRSSIVAAGLITIPVFAEQLLAATSFNFKAQLINMPQPLNHVRHGLFAPQQWTHPSLPSWLNIELPHRMFRNGISPADDDMVSTSLTLGKEQLTLLKWGDQFHLQTAAERHELSDHPFYISLDEGTIEYVVLKHDRAVDVPADAIFWPIAGNLIAGEFSLSPGQCLHSSADLVMRSRGEEARVLLFRNML